MKKLLLFGCSIVLLFVSLFFGVSQSFAQTTQKTPDQIAKEKGITFPIAELGSCKNYGECRTFCDDPLNKDACVAFAKKRGFYKEAQADSQKSEILNSAKTELGCDSPSSCQAFCSKSENHDKCEAFAKSHNLGGDQTVDPAKSQILEKAKSILGCDSPSSCKTFCEQEQNRAKCSEFAKGVGLRGGENKAGPGGCTTEETCRKFCSDPNNFEICQKFQGSVTGKPENFHGPGGCNSPESCKAYCQLHPSECGHVGESQFNASEVCSKTPNCSWSGTACQCSGFNPPSGTSSGKPSTNIKEDYCKQYPERCNFQKSPYPNYSPYPGTYSPGLTDPAARCKSSGGNWTGTYCQFPNQTVPSNNPAPTYNYSPQPSAQVQTPAPGSALATPAPGAPVTTSATKEQCVQGPGCFWNGTACICQAVRGASTQRSFFQTVLETLLRL